MAHQPLIDGLEFARAASRLQGVWPVAGFGRLRSALSTDAGTLRYELLGVPQEQGRPALRLNLDGALQLVCQRCLGEMLLAIPMVPRHQDCAGWLDGPKH